MKHYAVYVLVSAIFTAAYADPVDTAYDLLDAVSRQDGYALEDLLSRDLYSSITEFLNQARAFIETDPALAGDLLSERYMGRITVDDFQIMSNEEILGKLMAQTSLPPIENIEQETANLQGRSATVVLSYMGGGSISFTMIWEDSRWRISDSSLMSTMFR